MLTITVDTLLDEFDGSISDGDVSLRDALAVANASNNEVIDFDPHCLAGNVINLSSNLGELTISRSVTIDASLFPGLTISGLSADATPNAPDGRGIRLFNIDDGDANSLIDVEIIGLRLSGGDSAAPGGAIRTMEHLVLRRTELTGNHASSGGALWTGGAASTQLIDSNVAENSTSGSNGDGGGVYAAGPLNLLRTSISDNFTRGDLADGGGIKAVGVLSIESSTVAANRTLGNLSDGGGVAVGGMLTLIDGRIVNNSTIGASSKGGGIFAAAKASIIASSVAGNSTAGGNSDGGGIIAFDELRLERSTISNNSAAGSPGGGLYAANALIIASSTISGNSVLNGLAYGGGVFALGPTTVSYSTIADNSAAVEGGGLWLNGNAALITSTIVAGNVDSGTAPDLRVGAGSLFISFSLVGKNTGSGLSEAPTTDANGNLVGGILNGPLNPHLSPLGFYGGPTQTHALLSGSPAIDAGNLAAVPGVGETPAFDGRGAPFGRVNDGDDDMAASIDIGAFEVWNVSADFDSDGRIDGADFLTWQRRQGIASGAVKADGDADDDFDVDQTDLAIWRGMFGTAPPAGSSEVTVTAALTISTNTLEPPTGAEEANGDDFAAAAGWIALDSLLPYSIRSNKTTTHDVSAVTSLKAASFAAIGISPLPAVVAESPPASGPTEATSNSSQHALEVLDAAFAENVLNPLNEIFFLPA